MRKEFLLLISLTLSCPLHAESYSMAVHRYEGEIRRQERQLRSLQANMREKQEKVTLYKKMADKAKTQWEALADSVKTAQLKVSTVRGALLKTSQQVQVAGWQAALESRLSGSLDAELGLLTVELFKRQWAEPSSDHLAADSFPTQIVRRLTTYAPIVRQDAQAALRQKQSLEALAQQWQEEEARRQKEAAALKLTQTQEWKRWQDAERRQQLMKEEIAQAEQSAQALQIMLAQLKETRDQVKLERHERGGVQDPRLAQLRGALPWPAQGEIVQSFGRQYSSDLNQLLISNGIRVQARAGQPVRSIQPGLVIFARPFRNYGEMVVVQHDSGLASVYAGLATMSVQEGAKVAALDAVGTADATGRYYFELRQEERPLDPLVYLIPSRRMSS